MTQSEADAYRDGFADGWKLGFETGLGFSPEPTSLPDSNDDDPCRNQNPNHMCPKCRCWKMFREYCS